MTRQLLGRIAWERSGYITEDKREPMRYCIGYCECGKKHTITMEQIEEFNKNAHNLLKVPSYGHRRLQRFVFFLKNLSRLKLVVNVPNERLTPHDKML